MHAPNRRPESEKLVVGLFVAVIVVILGAVGHSVLDDRKAAADRLAQTNAEAARQKSVAAKRETDSAEAVTVVARGASASAAEWVSADRTIHRLGLVVEHADVHAWVVQEALDSAEKVGGGAGALMGDIRVGAIMADVHPPLTPTQELQRARIAAALERTRKAADAVAERGAHLARIKLREEYAARVYSSMLDSGMNMRVTAEGKDKSTLRMEYVLVDQVFVHQLSKGSTGILAALKDLGFTRLIVTDGFGKSWHWDL